MKNPNAIVVVGGDRRLTSITVALAAGVLLAVVAARGQGTFQNLDFELPNGPLSPTGGFPTYVAFTNAFPGWAGYIGQHEADVALYTSLFLDTATIALVTPATFRAHAIDGQYTAVLQPGVLSVESGFELVPASLVQSSLTPVSAKSLQFKVISIGTPWEVRANGDILSPVVLTNTGSYVLFGANISSYAGLLTELRFTAFPDNYPHGNEFSLDSIVFSEQVVPEPGAFAWLGLGALLFGARCFNKQRR